jgi:hypothetical protein
MAHVVVARQQAGHFDEKRRFGFTHERAAKYFESAEERSRLLLIIIDNRRRGLRSHDAAGKVTESEESRAAGAVYAPPEPNRAEQVK